MSPGEDNLKILYDRQPALKAKKLEALPSPNGFSVLQTPSGLPTAVLQGTTLHSRYDPKKEARRIVQQQAEPDTTAAVCFGFGLGYLAEAFSERFPDKPMVVIENDPGLFMSALKSRDLSTLLGSPYIFWHIGDEPEAIMMTIDKLPLRRVCLLPLRSLLGSGSSYYRRVETLLRSVFDRREVNVNTLRRFGKLWVRNLLNNLQHFICAPGVAGCKERFAGLPGLVLAAGPSLDRIAPALASLRQRMLLIAVDTSYRFCLRANIIPDFLVTVDPQYWNSRHLDWLELKGPILISESSANPRTFRLAGREREATLFISSFFPLGRYLEQILEEKGQIGAGGSVATTAWDLARYFGCGSIYMAGLDLGFPGKRTHSRGAFFEETMHTYSHRFLSAEQLTFDYLHQAQALELPNNAGGTTVSDRRMLIYKWWFENQMKQLSQSGGPPSFNLSAQGIQIEGMPFTPLEHLQSLPVVREKIDRALSSVRRDCENLCTGKRWARRHSAVRAGLDSLIGELERLRDLAQRAEELCSRYGNTAETGEQAAVVEKLAEIDREILTVSSRQIAAFLFQPLVRRILDNPAGPDDPSTVMATSSQLYKEMAGSASYHLETLFQILQRL